MIVNWCWDDPVVTIDGETITVEIGVQGAAELVRRSVRLAKTTIFLPEGATGETVSTTNEYFDETVQFITVPGAPDACIEVRFEAEKSLPVAMRVNGWVMDEGTTFGVLTTHIRVAQLA